MSMIMYSSGGSFHANSHLANYIKDPLGPLTVYLPYD